ncbi:MAG: ImmA/IrrE family metallo-endopeptidase [Lachnospiraceae bacterium]|nr:ImmA/IrrE family metallo-endopeptidase [Lachnospiraceae bacterium]
MLISKKRYKEIQRAAICCKKFSKTEEPFAALKNLDVEYSLINLEGDLPGFINSDYNSGKQYSPHVYINKRYGKYSQKIIAAHELGHVLLHKNDAINMLDADDKNSIREYEANIFAMEFMPQIQPKNYLILSPRELQEYIFSKLYLIY